MFDSLEFVSLSTIQSFGSVRQTFDRPTDTNKWYGSPLCVTAAHYFNNNILTRISFLKNLTLNSKVKQKNSKRFKQIEQKWKIGAQWHASVGLLQLNEIHMNFIVESIV